MDTARVGILMGSTSDSDAMRGAVDVLRQLGIEAEVRVLSAHRTPEAASDYASTARDRGLQVIIAGAGMAAHLAGAMAAKTTLPVIGVPIASGALNGVDALYATVQMPSGIPVATVGINGSKNAGMLAGQIIGVTDAAVAKRIQELRDENAAAILGADVVYE